MNGTITNKAMNHIKNNKHLYITGAVCLVAGAVGGTLACAYTKAGSDVSSNIAQIACYKPQATWMVNMIERSTLSKPVHLVGTNLYYNSMSEAARETGHSLQKISRHINGHVADLDGDVFELLEPAA